MSTGSLRRIVFPGAAIACALVAAHYRLDLVIAAWLDLAPLVATVPLALFGWISGSMTIIRALDLVVWDRVGLRRGVRPPQLLIQLSNVAIFIVSAVALATNVFGMPLTGVIATSSVIGLVVGFAVKSLISDTFSGIALNLDRGFSIGDFVQVMSRGIPGRLIGRVTEINWRSTYILTPENCVLVVPNTLMSESMVVNLSRPEVASEFEHILVLDFEVPSEQGVRILSAAIEAAAMDNAAIFDGKARITETSATGVHYKIKYMLDPARLAPGKAKHLLFGHVLRHLTKAGVKLAHPKQDSWMITGGPDHFAIGSADHRRHLIGQVELFRDLAANDIDMLTNRMQQRRLQPGAAIVRSGEPGDSMFVVSEGLVSVRIRGAEDEVDVARLAPGDFFGEMSVLTGEPRSASVVTVTDTVVYEIGKADVAALLDRNPGAAEVLSEAAAVRRVMSSAAAARSPEARDIETATIAGQILARMTKFFGRIRRPTAA